MRVSLKRLIIFSYLILCAFFSFLNYRQSTKTSDQLEIDQNIELNSNEKFADEAADQKSIGFWPALKKGFVHEMSAILPKRIFLWRFDEETKSIEDALWPEESNVSDRILAQIRFKIDRVPNVPQSHQSTDRPKSISIYLPNGLATWNVQMGAKEFQRHQCRMSNCVLTDEKSNAAKADAILFRNHFYAGLERKSEKQIWIFYTLESPENTPSLAFFKDQINWTATYRFDSDLVTPYEKFRLYSDQELRRRRSKNSDQIKNYAKGKKKQVAWFVSNCLTINRRHEYANRLAQYIQVDSYGTCGPLKCSRYDPNCGRLLDEEYRFYLAFENSNCRDYITEKFFVHGLQHNVIPIVMGAKKSDYTRVAPPHSFIHVDDFRSPVELAAYLHKLANNDTLYNEYFKWKGTGEFINTKFWCRLCAMLNTPKSKFYDVERWWHNPGVCTRGRWPSSSAFRREFLRNGTLKSNGTKQ